MPPPRLQRHSRCNKHKQKNFFHASSCVGDAPSTLVVGNRDQFFIRSAEAVGQRRLKKVAARTERNSSSRGEGGGGERAPAHSRASSTLLIIKCARARTDHFCARRRHRRAPEITRPPLRIHTHRSASERPSLPPPPPPSRWLLALSRVSRRSNLLTRRRQVFCCRAIFCSHLIGQTHLTHIYRQKTAYGQRGVAWLGDDDDRDSRSRA